MNELEIYFNQNQGRLIHKWIHYFEIYERHFNRFKGKDVSILEIGISHGGSLEMWKNYFGEKSIIYGLDKNPECMAFEEKNIKIFIGSQSDRRFLREIKEKIPPVDILIDDGGHTMKQQIITFEELFDHIKDDGVYVCEDIHTSYWLKYGGGYKRKYSYIEYCKNFIDYINAWHTDQKKLKITNFTRSVDSLHFYSGMLVIEKKERKKPYAQKKGKPSFEDSHESSSKKNILIKGRYCLNFILREIGLPNIQG